MAERSWQTQVYFSHRSPDWKHKYTATRAQVMLETSWNQHGQHRRFLATIYPCICASILCSLMYTPPATIYSCKSLPSHPHCDGGSHKCRIVQSVQPLSRWTLRSTLDMPPACLSHDDVINIMVLTSNLLIAIKGTLISAAWVW
jgi:hypothetical protein